MSDEQDVKLIAAARKLHLAVGKDHEGDADWQAEDFNLILAALRDVERETVEKACRAVCADCEMEEPLGEPGKRGGDRAAAYWHPDAPFQRRCMASVIRAAFPPDQARGSTIHDIQRSTVPQLTANLPTRAGTISEILRKKKET